MALLQRFDDESTPPITAEDIRRRWVAFHKQIRLMSGTRFQRTAGRILGEDTWRYHVARFIFRPLLKVLRLRRRKNAAKVTRVVAAKAATIFPINYRPLTIDYNFELATITFDESDVTIVEVDERLPSARELINQLNDLLNETTSEWLFLADATSSDESRRYSVAKLLAHVTKDDDVVFGDEPGPNEFAPILKSPAVAPHTLLSYNVVGRPALLRVETLFRAGGFSPDAGWAFEHDAYLRLSEAKARFHHVTIVLPAGRAPSSFDAAHLDADTCRVVQAAIDRRGWYGTVSPGALPGLVRWRLDAPTPSPSIDIIIPTRDRIDLVAQCISSIEEKTTYTNYDIIILDNDSVEPESLEYFDETKYSVIPCPGPFNYAKIVNRGVNHSSADYVVTLNNDTIVVTPDWLEQLIALASLPDVGIVGACLLDRDGRREHESIIIAPYPQHLRTDSNYAHVDYFSSAIRDVAAVTGAVQMVLREFWQHLGGMDEQLKVVMNDVDICLRAQMEDRYVIYTPDVRLYHHVGSSRGDLDPIDDRDRFVKRWDIFGSFRDPYFPESLLLLGEKMFYLLR
ncbi:MAG TPA: glycosyltransferase [Acidimicrobiales bacterium]|nr:glycosyltransferase [Acidimicrobiales bacterium]